MPDIIGMLISHLPCMPKLERDDLLPTWSPERHYPPDISSAVSKIPAPWHLNFLPL